MLNFNQVTILGRLVKDPELKVLSSGSNVCNFTVAVNRQFTSNGEKKEDVTYLDCEVYGKPAETIAKFMTKGRPIFVIGKLKQNNWKDAEGNNKSRLVVWVDNFEFVDSGGDKINTSDGPTQAPAANSTPPVKNKGKTATGQIGQIPQNAQVAPEQIPF